MMTNTNSTHIHWLHRHEVTSTNSYLKEMMATGIDLPELTVMDADFQTGGRGQLGNSWESERRKNLTFSLVCHPTFLPATRQFALSEAMALAVRDALSELTDGITVKWPNDIYWNDRKICGILIECNLSGATLQDCIIGVGVNVNQLHFTSDAPNPVSLVQIMGFTFNRKHLLEDIVNRFSTYYQSLKAGQLEKVAQTYRQHLYRKEGFHPYEEPTGERFEAAIIDVEPSGHLVVQTREGDLRKYELKQVRFIL